MKPQGAFDRNPTKAVALRPFPAPAALICRELWQAEPLPPHGALRNNPDENILTRETSLTVVARACEFPKVIIAEGPFFTGSAIKLRANRGLSPDFDLIKAIAGPHDVRTPKCRVGAHLGWRYHSPVR